MGFKQVLIAIDQLGNAVIGGYADETISARAYRQRDSSRAWKRTQTIIDGLFFWDKGQHCYLSYVSEISRHQMPAEYRSEP